MPYQRREADEHHDSQNGQQQVRADVEAFLNWTGCGDARLRYRAGEFAAALVREGKPVTEAVERTKQLWYEKRRRAGLPMRVEETPPAVQVAMMQALNMLLDHPMPPAAAATMFKAIEQEFPGEIAPRLTRTHCERLGDDWRNDEMGYTPAGEVWS
jgi:hypothetical protein